MEEGVDVSEEEEEEDEPLVPCSSTQRTRRAAIWQVSDTSGRSSFEYVSKAANVEGSAMAPKASPLYMGSR